MDNELQVEANNYSLWGGSAGARMTAWVGNDYDPQPSAVIMEYTGLPLFSLTVTCIKLSGL